ncbi:hypothetical protein P7C73_g3249, partial [Tremellales sp. Uapishka_1]
MQQPVATTSATTLAPAVKAVRTLQRKPKSPHPSHDSTTTKRRAPPLPPRSVATNSTPTLPIKPYQGRGTRRTDSTKDGYGRDVIFVTRKTGLGVLLGRCRSLVVTEGYTHLTLHAMGAAIPQALILLHALLDLLPFPVGASGMWYDIKTGSVECVDEKGDEDGEQIGAMEEKEPERQIRVKSSITIELHISSRPAKASIEAKKTGKNRPSKRKRAILAAIRRGEDVQEETNEEEMLNGGNEGMDVDEEEEEEEAVEELEP